MRHTPKGTIPGHVRGEVGVKFAGIGKSVEQCLQGVWQAPPEPNAIHFPFWTSHSNSPHKSKSSQTKIPNPGNQKD